MNYGIVTQGGTLRLYDSSKEMSPDADLLKVWKDASGRVQAVTDVDYRELPMWHIANAAERDLGLQMRDVRRAVAEAAHHREQIRKLRFLQ